MVCNWAVFAAFLFVGVDVLLILIAIRELTSHEFGSKAWSFHKKMRTKVIKDTTAG